MASRVFTEPSEVKSALYSQNPIQSAAIAMVEVPFKPRLKWPMFQCPTRKGASAGAAPSRWETVCGGSAPRKRTASTRSLCHRSPAVSARS